MKKMIPIIAIGLLIVLSGCITQPQSDPEEIILSEKDTLKYSLRQSYPMEKSVSSEYNNRYIVFQKKSSPSETPITHLTVSVTVYSNKDIYAQKMNSEMEHKMQQEDTEEFPKFGERTMFYTKSELQQKDRICYTLILFKSDTRIYLFVHSTEDKRKIVKMIQEFANIMESRIK